MPTGSNDRRRASAVFVGAARDCARDLPRALARWTALAELFETRHFFVAENDSRDATATLLARWAEADPRRRVLTLDGLSASGATRTERLAFARNRLLDEVRATPTARDADLLIVMDLDDASAYVSPRGLTRCMAHPGWDALFANQLFFYNDIWALRHETRSPDDFLLRIHAAPPGWRRRLARLRHMTWRNRPIAPFAPPFRVTSAFGGFAVYRMPVALAARYQGRRDGHDVCEHVPFNEAIAAAGGRLFVHPGLVNDLPRFLEPFARVLLGRDVE